MKITKLDESVESSQIPLLKKKEDTVAVAGSSCGGRKRARKTQKTYPRGILKIKPTHDPAKSPPLKKTAKRRVIQIMTDKGSKSRRKTIRKIVAGYSNDKVRSMVEKHGLLKNKNTPPALMRDMLEGGAIAGFISLD